MPIFRSRRKTSARRSPTTNLSIASNSAYVTAWRVPWYSATSLSVRVAGLLDTDYSTNQMSYDLRRLRLHGLIERIPATNTYRTTPEGQRVAVFYPKLRNRLLRPLLNAPDRPPAPIQLRKAMETIDHTLNNYITHARLGAAA